MGGAGLSFLRLRLMRLQKRRALCGRPSVPRREHEYLLKTRVRFDLGNEIVEREGASWVRVGEQRVETTGLVADLTVVLVSSTFM
jgi:predicted site-specific integrase-resolvase